MTTTTRENAEALAGTYFAQATTVQHAAYHAAIQSAVDLPNDAWRALRDLARRQFDHDTREARELFDRTVLEVMATGEVSEATSYLWDEIGVGAAMLDAAE